MTLKVGQTVLNGHSLSFQLRFPIAFVLDIQDHRAVYRRIRKRLLKA